MAVVVRLGLIQVIFLRLFNSTRTVVLLLDASVVERVVMRAMLLLVIVAMVWDQWDAVARVGCDVADAVERVAS